MSNSNSPYTPVFRNRIKNTIAAYSSPISTLEDNSYSLTTGERDTMQIFGDERSDDTGLGEKMLEMFDSMKDWVNADDERITMRL